MHIHFPMRLRPSLAQKGEGMCEQAMSYIQYITNTSISGVEYAAMIVSSIQTGYANLCKSGLKYNPNTYEILDNLPLSML